MAKLNRMFLVRLNNRGDGRIEAVLGLPDAERARKLRQELRYGRVRKCSLHVAMTDLPEFLSAMGGPAPLVSAAERLKLTIPSPGEVTDMVERNAAIQQVAVAYAEATCSAIHTG